MITAYTADTTDFTNNGLGPLAPIECTVSETLNGMWELTLTHARDELGKCGRLQMGNIIKAPVPAGFTPQLNMSEPAEQREIWAVNIDERVALRAGPSQGDRLLHAYKRGTEVVVLDKPAGNYWEVVTPDGRHGWMWHRFLTYVKTESGAAAQEEIREARALREQPFRIYRIEPGIDTVTVSARHVFYDLAENLLGSCALENATGAEAARGIMAACRGAHDFTMYSDLTGTGSGDYTDRSPTEAIFGDGGLCDTWNAEIARDWWDIYAVERVGRDTDVVIRQGKNLKGLRGDIDMSNAATHIVPVGTDEDGKALYLPGDAPWVDSEAIGQYPLVKWRLLQVQEAKVGRGMSLDEALDAMRAAAQAALDEGCDAMACTLDVDFVNLGDTDEYSGMRLLYDVAMGDSVRVITPGAGLDMRMRVTDYTYDCLARRYKTLSLGTVADTMATVGISARQIANASLSGAKLIRGSVGAEQLQDLSVSTAKIALASIDYAHIKAAAVEQLATNALTAITARIQELIAQHITTDDLYAALATIGAAQITTANIERADIEWAQISDLQAEIATIITLAARQGKFDFAKIQDLLASAMILEEGVAGTVYIRNLIATHANFVGAIIGDLVLQGDDGLYYDVSVQSDGTIYASQRAVTDDELRAGITADGHQIVATTANVADLNAENIRANSAIIGSIFTQALVAGKITASEAFLASATVPELYAAAIKAVGDSLDLTANESIRLIVRDSSDIGTMNLIRINDPEHPVHIYQGSVVSNATDEPFRRSLREFQMAKIPANYIEFPSPFKVHGSNDLKEKYTLSFWAWSTSSYEDLAQTFAVNLSDMNLYGTKQDAYVGPVFSLGEDTSLTATYPAGYAGPVYSIDGNGNAIVSFSDILRCVLVDHNGVEHDVCTGGVGTLNTPERTERTFDIDFTDTVYLRIYSSNVAWSLSDVKIERGSVATGWSANPYEFETSGSEVVINEHEVFIGTERFVVDITNAGQRFTMDETGGSMNYLRVNTLLTAPNVAMAYTGLPSPTIGPGGTYGSLTEFSEAVNGRTLPFDVTASITGTLYETVTLGGMQGPGQLTITGTDSPAVSGSVTIRNTGTAVIFSGVTFSGSVLVTGGQAVRFSNVKFNGNGGTRALRAEYGASCILDGNSGCELYNATRLIDVYMARLTAVGAKGGFVDGATDKYGVYGEDSVIIMAGSRPDGSVHAASCLTEPADLSTLTVNSGSAPQSGGSVTTGTFQCTASKTNYNDTHWNSDSRIRQGYSSMTGGNYEQRGCFWFNLSGLSGKTVKSAWLTLTRISGYGRSSEVSVKLYTTPLASASGNPMTGAADRGTIGTIANGETKQFAIPAAAVGSGAASGFMVCINDGTLMSGRGYSTNYAHFCGYGEANPPVLTVTYQ